MGAGDASERNCNRKCLERERVERCMGFADEDEEEAFNLAGTQLNEALASERNARRTDAPARAIMHDIKSSRGG